MSKSSRKKKYFQFIWDNCKWQKEVGWCVLLEHPNSSFDSCHKLTLDWYTLQNNHSVCFRNAIKEER